MERVKQFLSDYLHIWICLGVGIVCATFLLIGNKAEDGTITLDAKPAQISEGTKKWIESQEEAMYRLMNEDAPTDEATVKEFMDAKGQGGSTTLEQVKARRLSDGDTDNGKGWQCSKYTAYLATGRREYSASHPDYGPVNGRDVAQWLVDNYGWKYVDTPVEGAIGSGGFNTLYGHTVEFLYWVSDGVAMVSDANYVPLTVATHPMNVSGWVWVVPSDYAPDSEPEPTPVSTPSGDVTYSYVPGDTFGQVLLNLGLSDGSHLWGNGGDVEVYTKQLVEQNVLDYRGNVLLYTPFTLQRRK